MLSVNSLSSIAIATCWDTFCHYKNIPYPYYVSAVVGAYLDLKNGVV